MRAMMAGAAHVEHEDGTHTSLTSRAVFEESQIPPTVVELTIRRLGWWQSIMNKPEHHRHYLSAFFGECRFEERARAAGAPAAARTVLANGELNPSMDVHPWAR
eukprot:7431977-Pyramimonas_sp.AAC.1